jgi:hypothetical protein
MEMKPMQIVHKYSRPAYLSVNHPSHLGPGISFFLVDRDPVHMQRIKFGLILLVNWRADVTASALPD